MIDTTDYGKQAYLMCEDLATQLNFLKNKNSSPNADNGNTDKPVSNQSQTMIELLGPLGTGSVEKKYLTFYPTAGQTFKYTVLLKITNVSTDGQFHAHIFFDNKNMSKKVFMVSGGKANVLFDFEYLSESGEVEVEIVVESFVADTQFCLDQIVTISNDQALTCDYPHRYDGDASYKLSLGFLGEPNSYGLTNTYSVAFEQDNMLYTGMLESKNFDIERLTYYAKTSPYNFNAYSTLATLSDGSVGFGSANMYYSSGTRSYCYNHCAKVSKAMATYLQQADIAPFARTDNDNIESQGIMKYNQAYSYNIMNANLSIAETYPISFDGFVVDKIVICKPRTVQEAKTNLPIAMIDSDKVAHIYYNYVDAQNGLSFDISNVNDIFCVYGSSLTELQVYVSIDSECYQYRLSYNSSTKKFTQKAKTKLGTYTMFYPGFGDEAFYIIDGKICYTKNRDLL